MQRLRTHRASALSINKGLFTSTRADWATPQGFFDELDAEFGFTLDVCATAETAKCRAWYAEKSLERRWEGTCWMNPPYGREIGRWVEKAYNSAYNGTTVVCLLPSRTDTRWWHDYVMKASEIRFIKGRLHFDGHENNAPFPSAVVIFNADSGEGGTVRSEQDYSHSP